MLYIFLAVSAVVPSFLVGWYFHKRDWYPEPPRLLWATFGLGVLTVIAVLPVELMIGAGVDLIAHPVANGFLNAFLVAAIPEEAVKLAVLLGFAYRRREFNEPMDGVVYGVMAALGFATLENVLYVFQGGIGIAVMRALTAVPSHATEGAIMGYFAGRAKFSPGGKFPLIAAGFIAAVILHGLYDFPLLSISAAAEAAGGSENVPPALAALIPITLIALAVSIVWALLAARKLRKEQLASAPPLAPGQALTPGPAGAPGKAWSIAILVIGFILAAAGGVMTLGLLIGLMIGAVEEAEIIYFLIGSVLIGVAPLVLGLALFTWGIVRLNRAAPPPQHFYPRPPYQWPPPLTPPPLQPPLQPGPPGPAS